VRLNSFNHFRAIATVLIVAGHSYEVVGMEFNTLLENSLRNLITGGTSLFVFISGFLFHHVFFKRYQYHEFLLKKVNGVLIPYLLLGLTPVILRVLLKKDSHDGAFLPDGIGVLDEYIVPAVKYYSSGAFLTAYWYIPFITLMFLASPLHVRYAKLQLHSQIAIILAASAISIFVHRPYYNINVLHSFVYFTPIYLIGITTSINRDFIYSFLRDKLSILLFLVIFLAVFQAYIGQHGNYHKNFFDWGGIDIIFFQKLAMCFLFMVWLVKFEDLDNRLIHAVASTSFTAFFIHPFVILVLNNINLPFLKLDSWALLAAFVTATISFCVLIAKTTKKIAPKYSKFIIGY